ncbi:MAG TPA: hypothetical protein VKK31_15975 [Thermoanaerobaculia bacterium]|nr:hypothetical protein [Thermoanaerobaculia bacterium]
MPKSILRSSWALALLAGLLAPGIATAQASGTPTGSLHDGVVVDAASGAAYVMSRQGGIDALDLTTGNVLWQSRDAAKPLLVQGGTLVAQAAPSQHGKLAVVALDAKRGTVKQRVDVELPAAVRAHVFDGPSQAFRVQAFSTADNAVAVVWTAEEGRSFQGIMPEPEGAPAKSAVSAAAQPLRGAARLDLGAGRAVPMAYEKAMSQKDSAIEAKSLKDVNPRQLTSLDGRHVLNSERLPDGKLWAQYRWTVTDADGATVGTIEAPVSMAPFVVSGSRILYVAQPSVRREGNKMVEEPLRLRALDLQTGAEMWTALVTDSAYRGPFPP